MLLGLDTWVARSVRAASSDGELALQAGLLLRQAWVHPRHAAQLDRSSASAQQ